MRVLRPALALIVLASLATTARATDDRPERPPNIVLIMADDAGIEAFGCYGGRSCSTPNIDALAAQGVRFTNAHAQPLCTPSRVKILTGLSNVRNYVRFGILDPNERTIAHVLRERGYRTAIAGKWQLYGSAGAIHSTGARPEDAGFDEHCLWQIDAIGSRYWKPVIDLNGRRLETTDDDYGPDLFVRFVTDFIDRREDGPFFVYYPMVLPHGPFVPTPDGPGRASTDRQANFEAMVGYVDSAVGRIVAHLDERDLRRDTLLVFTADNGTDRSISCRTTSGLVKGGKSLTLDRGTHVPFIASWPGTAAPRVCPDLVDLADLLPTLAEAAGGPGPAVTDGRSILPQVLGAPAAPREWIYCYYDPRPGSKRFPRRRFAHDARWKLYADGRLFDVVVDPEEERPLAPDDESDVRARLRAVIRSFPETGLRVTSGGRVRDSAGHDVSVRGLTISRQQEIPTRFVIESPPAAKPPIRLSITAPTGVYVRTDGAPLVTAELETKREVLPIDVAVTTELAGAPPVLHVDFVDAEGRRFHLAARINATDDAPGTVDRP